jgi:hypothetical protein
MIPLGLFFSPAVIGLFAAAALLREFQEFWLPDPHSKAEKRALALLRSWLTPEQKEQWSARGEFEVVGCDTGTRYRLTSTPSMNVHQLDRAGRTVRRWCFMPSGGLVLGDVLLAQKIALETMEQKTLALANSQSCLPAHRYRNGTGASSAATPRTF